MIFQIKKIATTKKNYITITGDKNLQSAAVVFGGHPGQKKWHFNKCHFLNRLN